MTTTATEETKIEGEVFRTQHGRDVLIGSISEYKGKRYAAVRVYYYDEVGNLKPGKAGINLLTSEFWKLNSAVQVIAKSLSE